MVALGRLAPALPAFEAGVVADRALDSRGLAKARPDEAAWLALVAYARHEMTDYDRLFDDGYEVDSARFFVRDDINAVLESWGTRRRVAENEPPEPRLTPAHLPPRVRPLPDPDPTCPSTPARPPIPSARFKT